MKFEYTKHKVAPFDVRYPDDFKKFIMESLQPTLIYDRHKRTAHCSKCGSTFSYVRRNSGDTVKDRTFVTMDYFRARDVINCPICRERMLAVPHTTYPWITEKTIINFWNEGDKLRFAVNDVYWRYDGQDVKTFEERAKIDPRMFGEFTRKAQNMWGMWGSDQLIKESTISLVGYAGTGYSNYAFPPDTPDVIKESFIKVRLTPGDLYNANYFIKSVAAYARHPQLEYLDKAGLKDLTKRIIYEVPTYIYPDWKAKSVAQFLRLSPQDLDKLKNWKMFNADGIFWYKTIKKFKKPLLEDMKCIDKIRLDSQEYRQHFRAHNPAKLAKYLLKVYEDNIPQCSRGMYGYSHGYVRHEYLDYLKQLEELGYPAEEYYFYPKNFPEANRRVDDEYREMLARKRVEEEKERQKELRKQEAKYKKRLETLEEFTYGEGNLFIRPLRSQEEFILEGHNNHNCVASYYRRALTGDTSIFVIRKIDDPDASFVTLELSKDRKRIVQCFGKGNTIPPQEVTDFAQRWLREVVNNKKRKKVA